MGKSTKYKFNFNDSQKRNNFIPPISGYNNLFPVFSLKEYIISHKHFCPENCNEKRNSLYNFMRNLKELSKFTWGHMKNNPKIFHFHTVDEDISELNKYSDVDLAQFKVPGQKQGRIVGFFDENNIFNILLYDSEHQIYSRN